MIITIVSVYLMIGCLSSLYGVDCAVALTTGNPLDWSMPSVILLWPFAYTAIWIEWCHENDVVTPYHPVSYYEEGNDNESTLPPPATRPDRDKRL